jgi:hypothetical protein
MRRTSWFFRGDQAGEWRSPSRNRIERDFSSATANQRSDDGKDAALPELHPLTMRERLSRKDGVTAVLQPLPEFPDLVVLFQIRECAQEILS